jgi:large repetitive protein
MKFITYILFLLSIASYSQENCNNGIDDDGDGKIDLNDPECACSSTAAPSIIPNPSFEVHSSCPTNYSVPGDDQLSLATPWIQATEATSDYHNSCGYVAGGITSSGLGAFPDGTAAIGILFIDDWKEYIGTQLLSPMTAGTNYQLTLNIAALVITGQGLLANSPISNYEPVNITLYGCSNGSNLPVSTTFSPNLADPTWIEIGHVTYSPISTWGEVTLTFTPSFNINAIMIGAPPILPLSYLNNSSGYPYFLFDNLLLNLASVFGVNISQNGIFCDNNLVLTANLTTTLSPAVTYQWYLNGIAIIGATNPTYNVPAFTTSLGNYSVKVTDGANCYISSKATINNTISSPSNLTIQPNCIVPTGTITITSPGFQFSFDNGVTWQSSPTKSLLPTGTYYIKVKTINGCISSATGVNIIEPQLLSGSNLNIVQPTTCYGLGSITIISSVASEYSFDDGLTWTTNSTANNLIPGNYLIKIKDISGCQSASQFVSIYRVYLSSPQYTAIQPSCSSLGTIAITTTADQYSFDDGVTWTTNPIASNLPTGIYLIKIKNANGCESYSDYVYLNTAFLNVTPTYTVTQPICGTAGMITITTTALEYSFDNGTTWSTNNVASNLAPGIYYIMIRNNTFCTSYPIYVYLNAFYLNDPTYTATQPSCGVGGEITITTSADEYSFDGGVTWTTNPVATNLSSGTYYIMIKNNLGCVSDYIYVNLNYSNLPNPLFVTTNVICGAPGSITITTPAFEYSFDGGITWTTNPTLTNLQSGYYYIKIRNASNCESNYITVYLENFEDTYPQYTYTNADCGVYATITITSLADFYSFDGGTTWTTNPVAINLLGNQYYNLIIRNGTSCISLTANLFLANSYYPIPLATDYQTTLCDDLNDGSENVDLSLYNTNLIANSTLFNFTYFTSLVGAETNNFSNQILNFNSCNLSNSNNTVYVRVTSSDGCYKVVELKFTFIDSPVIVMENSYILCEFKKVLVDAGPGFDSYLWSTGETTQTIFITEIGNYSVTVTENHSNGLICNSTKTFTIILSNPATFTSIETVDWTDFDNSITIYVSGAGIYEYSIDGIHYQDSNIFFDLESGFYTVYVRDKNECGIVEQDVFLLMYPRYFTPNNDGFHDTWNVRFAINEPGIKVEIYDRFGKFLKNLTYNTNWDGTYNNTLLPSTDYWFVVTRANGKIYKGHFALKR